MGSTAPLWGRYRRVVTVHDLIYARFPEAHAGMRDKGMRVLVPWAARRSQRLIADSQSTRADLIALLGLSPERIDVVPLGLGALARAQPAAERDVRERFALGERSVALSLSAKRPHKNLLALIGALALIPAERRPVLVLPGYATAYETELRARATALGLGADVRFPAWVSGAKLEGLWAIARAFVFPSLYEGFGLPVLEAMARGVPVACSDASSLPEVAGEAALLFDPRDERADRRCALAPAGGRAAAPDADRARQRSARGEFTWAAHRAPHARQLQAGVGTSARRHRSPDERHVVGGEGAVAGDDRAALQLGLSDQQAIERVAVMQRQRGGGVRVARVDREHLSASFVDAIEQVIGRIQLAYRALDRHLPDVDDADDQLGSGRSIASRARSDRA